MFGMKTKEERRLYKLLARRKRLDGKLIKAGNARRAKRQLGVKLTAEYEAVVKELRADYQIEG
jgi:hypothetical protein